MFNEPIGARRVSQLNARGGPTSRGTAPIWGRIRQRGKPIRRLRSRGKKTLHARGFQLANAAAKAVVKVGVRRRQEDRSARGEGTRPDVGKGRRLGTDENGEENEVAEGVWNHSEPRAMSAPARRRAGALAASVAASRRRVLRRRRRAVTRRRRRRPTDASGTSPRRTEARRRSQRIAPRHRARVAARALLRDSLWAVAPGGPACLLPLACPALCSKTFAPRRLRLRMEGEGRARAEGGGCGGGGRQLSVMGRACEGDGAGAASSLDALAAIDAPRLIALALPSAIDAMRAVHERRGRAMGGG